MLADHNYAKLSTGSSAVQYYRIHININRNNIELWHGRYTRNSDLGRIHNFKVRHNVFIRHFVIKRQPHEIFGPLVFSSNCTIEWFLEAELGKVPFESLKVITIKC